MPLRTTCSRWATCSRLAVRTTVDDIAKQGATPLVVVDGARVMGVVQLKDIVKGGIKERFTELRQYGHQDDHDHRR